jgi:hypothetical protein
MDIASRFQPLMATIARVRATISSGEHVQALLGLAEGTSVLGVLIWRGGRWVGSHAKERADARSPRVWTTLPIEAGTRPHTPQGAPSAGEGRSIDPRLS